MIDLLTTTTAAWGIPLNDQQQTQFAVYLQELQTWNARLNLTAITDIEGIVVRHFLDSLRCALSWGVLPSNVIDVGTGAGFPGLPLKLLRPQIQLTLVESIEKKAAFLRHLVSVLALDNIDIIVARAESIGRDAAHREHYDVVLARAVADLRVLAEYCLPLCRVGGRFLAPKGSQIDSEIAQASHAITTLGGHLLAVEPVILPQIESRTLVVVDKVITTPLTYPRKIGLPVKRPL